MFFYFGYGSNLSVVSLRAKGVDPLSSEPAQLEGYRLVFNLPDFFAIEGGTGNIVPGAPDDVVHGALHSCRGADLQRLDELEAVGVTYRRVETTVTAYDGRRVRAYVYLGLPHLLDARCKPSERYRNILVRGATDMRLDPHYIERLKAIETASRPTRPPFEGGAHTRAYTLIELAQSPTLVGLLGFVFDMRNAEPRHGYLRRLLGGKDATLLFAKRMASSDGTETVDDLLQGRFNDEQRAHLNEYLHEFAREYELVGTLDYRAPHDACFFAGASDRKLTDRPERPERTSFRLSFMRTNNQPRPVVGPARKVLCAIEEENEASGHENAGSLSVTHGFMPRAQPSRALPKEFAAWDQAAAALPSLYRTLSLRRTLDELPLLSADPESLPDHALLRAAQVLGILSHAYQYVESVAPERRPEALEKPWAEVRRRLGRPSPAVISYVDLIVNNWRLIDESAKDPVRASNMRLLVPTVDNQEERIFYLTQTEILARASPIVVAVVLAQEAALMDDQEALESALVTITSCLQRITRESLLSIDPNPLSATYVNPVVWAKTVAPFAVPFQQGVQGPSGTSSPIFNTLDVFLGRSGFQTFLGREIRELRSTYPRGWQEFLAALAEVSVPQYVNARGTPRLRGLFKEVSESYTGQNGFLGRHRMKVYGYLELAFKVGRTVTIGGFQGVFKDRTWDQVDAELEKARQERAADLPQATYSARVASVSKRRASGVSRVVLDVSGTGLRYETWDRCGVLPENDPELVEKTLCALRVKPDLQVALTPEWRAALETRKPSRANAEVSVAELVSLGKIRPLVPRAAEALHAASQNAQLKRLIDEGNTEKFELWDTLEMLIQQGFDPRVLFEATAAGQLLCEVIPPETFRMYSISSRPTSANMESPTRIELNVADLSYQSPRADTGELVTRKGTASTFLKSAEAQSGVIPVIIEHPPRFGLPKSARVPIVLIAGGTGIAPFLALLDDRSRDTAAADTLVLFGARAEDKLVYDKDFLPALQAGHTSIFVALSNEQRTMRYVLDAEGIMRRELYKEGCGRVPELVEDPQIAARLYHLLRSTSDGGLGSHVYVCGRSRFARSALDAIEDVFYKFHVGSVEERRAFARAQMRGLFAEGRLKEETFSGEEPASNLPSIDASEVALHNDDAHGHWMIIDHRVYDLSEFVNRHPGGRHVLLGYSGMDASEGYHRVHARRSEVDASREMHLIGRLRVPDLREKTAEVLTPSGPRVVSLGSVYRAFVSALFLAVEMQNALRNDHALQHAKTTRDEVPERRSLYRLERAIETHERFQRSYLEVLTRETLPNLLDLTFGFFRAQRPAKAERQSPLVHSKHMAFATSITVSLRSALATLTTQSSYEETDPEAERALLLACEMLEEEDSAVLAALKEHLCTSVKLFEVYEAHLPERAVDELCLTLLELEQSVSHYAARIYTRLSEQWAWQAERESEPPSAHERHRTTLEVLARNAHWTLEEDGGQRVVTLRRSALPFASIEAVVNSNEQILSCVRDDHLSFGIVVDMRQAPGRNDPAFEQAMRKLRITTEQRFARLSVLVESTAGLLQVSRLERSDRAGYLVTTSEIAALRFARGET